MKIFKMITIATVANGFKLIEDTDYFKGELTTTTATTTTDTTTTINATSETATEYGDAEATTTTETTTTGARPYFEYYLSDGQKLQRLQDIALKKYEKYRFLNTEYSEYLSNTIFRTSLRDRYEEYVCMVLRRLRQQRPNYCDLEASDSVIETPKLELQSMRQSH